MYKKSQKQNSEILILSCQNVRLQLLGGEPSSEAIILEEAEYKLEEVTSVIDKIMVCTHS